MCGSSSSQSQIEKQQDSAYQQLTTQAGQIFGNSSSIFNDLVSAMSPILANGPDQNGFSAQELAALNSQAITNSGQAYRNAAQAAGERTAAAGGGNQLLPSGAASGQQAAIAEAGAQNTSSQLTNIALQNAATGRQNWLTAAGVLSGAPNVFGVANSAGSVATGAGSAAANTANQIAQQGNAWMGALGGVLGGVAGSLTGGLLGSGGASGPPVSAYDPNQWVPANPTGTLSGMPAPVVPGINSF